MTVLHLISWRIPSQSSPTSVTHCVFIPPLARAKAYRWKSPGKSGFFSSVLVSEFGEVFSIRSLMDNCLLLGVLCVLVVCMLSSSARGRGDVLELTDADFDYLASEQETMLVKFYAPW